MKILAVDDEKIGLELLAKSIQNYDSDIEVFKFRSAEKALEFATESVCEVAFLDLQMDEINGLELAAALKTFWPDVKIVFATGFAEYAVDAFAIHADGYMLKPITPAKVKTELDHILEKKEQTPSTHKVSVRCFGNFDVFVDGAAINFKYTKTKELFAYLVDRKGATCSNGEISSILWEHENHDSYLRNIKKDLMDTFKSYSCEDVINSSHGKLNVQIKSIECDYYKWLDSDSSIKYLGEYMTQYSWAESTNAWLDYNSKG